MVPNLWDQQSKKPTKSLNRKLELRLKPKIQYQIKSTFQISKDKSSTWAQSSQKNKNEHNIFITLCRIITNQCGILRAGTRQQTLAQMQISCMCCPGSQIVSQTKTAARETSVDNKGPKETAECTKTCWHDGKHVEERRSVQNVTSEAKTQTQPGTSPRCKNTTQKASLNYIWVLIFRNH